MFGILIILISRVFLSGIKKTYEDDKLNMNIDPSEHSNYIESSGLIYENKIATGGTSGNSNIEVGSKEREKDLLESFLDEMKLHIDEPIYMREGVKSKLGGQVFDKNTDVQKKTKDSSNDFLYIDESEIDSPVKIYLKEIVNDSNIHKSSKDDYIREPGVDSNIRESSMRDDYIREPGVDSNIRESSKDDFIREPDVDSNIRESSKDDYIREPGVDSIIRESSKDEYANIDNNVQFSSQMIKTHKNDIDGLTSDKKDLDEPQGVVRKTKEIVSSPFNDTYVSDSRKNEGNNGIKDMIYNSPTDKNGAVKKTVKAFEKIQSENDENIKKYVKRPSLKNENHENLVCDTDVNFKREDQAEDRFILNEQLSFSNPNNHQFDKENALNENLKSSIFLKNEGNTNANSDLDILENNCVLIAPIVYDKSVKRYFIISESSNNPMDAYKDFSKVSRKNVIHHHDKNSISEMENNNINHDIFISKDEFEFTYKEKISKDSSALRPNDSYFFNKLYSLNLDKDGNPELLPVDYIVECENNATFSKDEGCETIKTYKIMSNNMNNVNYFAKNNGNCSEDLKKHKQKTSTLKNLRKTFRNYYSHDSYDIKNNQEKSEKGLQKTPNMFKKIFKFEKLKKEKTKDLDFIDKENENNNGDNKDFKVKENNEQERPSKIKKNSNTFLNKIFDDKNDDFKTDSANSSRKNYIKGLYWKKEYIINHENLSSEQETVQTNSGKSSIAKKENQNMGEYEISETLKTELNLSGTDNDECDLKSESLGKSVDIAEKIDDKCTNIKETEQVKNDEVIQDIQNKVKQDIKISKIKLNDETDKNSELVKKNDVITLKKIEKPVRLSIKKIKERNLSNEESSKIDNLITKLDKDSSIKEHGIKENRREEQDKIGNIFSPEISNSAANYKLSFEPKKVNLSPTVNDDNSSLTSDTTCVKSENIKTEEDHINKKGSNFRNFLKSVSDTKDNAILKFKGVKNGKNTDTSNDNQKAFKKSKDKKNDEGEKIIHIPLTPTLTNPKENLNDRLIISTNDESSHQISSQPDLQNFLKNERDNAPISEPHILSNHADKKNDNLMDDGIIKENDKSVRPDKNNVSVCSKEETKNKLTKPSDLQSITLDEKKNVSEDQVKEELHDFLEDFLNLDIDFQKKLDILGKFKTQVNLLSIEP